MVKPPRRNTEAELDAFELTCERLNGFNGGIGFEQVDGFLAALAAAPRLPAPERWLPALCGDAFERAFGDPQSHAQALQSLQVRLAVLCDQLDPEALFDDPESLRLDPLMHEVTAEDRQRFVDGGAMTAEQAALAQTGALWADGFFEAVRALPDVWEVPADDGAADAFHQAFLQVEALVHPLDSDAAKAHAQQFYPDPPAPTRDDLVVEACMAVQDLRLYWVDFAPRPATRRVVPTPGRNDPCPCGSGKKYKKCHGTG